MNRQQPAAVSAEGRVSRLKPEPGVDGNAHCASQHVLSGRESRILRLIGAGLSAKEIAYDLKLNAKTVSTYRSRLSHKLGLHR